MVFIYQKDKESYDVGCGIHESCRDFFEKYGKDWESGRFELVGQDIKG